MEVASYSCGGIEKNHEKPKSGYLVSNYDFKWLSPECELDILLP